MWVCSAPPTAPGVSAPVRSFPLRRKSAGVPESRPCAAPPQLPQNAYACHPEALGCRFRAARRSERRRRDSESTGRTAELRNGRDPGALVARARLGAGCRAAPPQGRGGSRGLGRGEARARTDSAADTHSARTPDSPLPPPPYCSRPGRPRGLKPRENLRETGRGGACIGEDQAPPSRILPGCDG